MQAVLWKPAILGFTAALAVLVLYAYVPAANVQIGLAALVVLLTHSLHCRELVRALRAERAVRAAEERYRDLFENVTDLIQSARPDGTFLYVNRAWRETLGYREDEVAGLSIFDVVHPDALAASLDLFHRVMAGEDLDRIEVRFVTRDGRPLPLEGSVSCRFEDGKPLATRAIFRDVSARQRAEEELRLSEVRYQSLVESLPQCIFRKDVEGRFTFANRRFCELLGEPLSVVLHKTDHDYFPPDLAEKYRRDDQTVMATGIPLETVEEYQNAAGERVHVQVVKVPLRDEAGRLLGIQGIFWDVTERVRAEEEIRRLAQRDGLTDLWNRRSILEILDRELARSQREGSPVGLVLADLDHFKRVNDRLGHQTGDAVLREVAQRMGAALRPYDTVGRYGGEEFLIVLPGCDLPQTRKLSERLREAVAATPVTHGERQIEVTMSLGLAVSAPTLALDADTLLLAADAALYRAKEAGRDRVEIARGPSSVGT